MEGHRETAQACLRVPRAGEGNRERTGDCEEDQLSVKKRSREWLYVPILAKALATLLRQLDMALARLAEGADLLFGRSLREERLDESNVLWLHGADGFRASMEE